MMAVSVVDGGDENEERQTGHTEVKEAFKDIILQSISGLHWRQKHRILTHLLARPQYVVNCCFSFRLLRLQERENSRISVICFNHKMQLI
jgi:ribosomal protein S26